MILTNLLVPPTWAIGYQVVCFTAVVAVFSVLVGLLESFRARNKMGKNPPYLLTLTALGLLGLIVALLIIQKIA
jgi:formate hydrogenlyase subunit 4